MSSVRRCGYLRVATDSHNMFVWIIDKTETLDVLSAYTTSVARLCCRMNVRRNINLSAYSGLGNTAPK